VLVAGVVTHRQHPETANGAVFINLEDETGHVNVMLLQGRLGRWSLVARKSPALMIRGTLQRGQGTLALRRVRRATTSGRDHAVTRLALNTASPRRDHCAITRTARYA